MKQIKVFKIDFPFENVQLSGVCRWIENSVQVEMLQPYEWYDGIKFFKDKEPLPEQQVRKVAVPYASHECEKKLCAFCWGTSLYINKYRK